MGSVDLSGQEIPESHPGRADLARTESAIAHVGAAEAVRQGGVAGDYACIEARDIGCGMSPEVLAQAFDAFFTARTADRGSEMGLALVRGFARQARGFVTVDSAPAAGATFRI